MSNTDRSCRTRTLLLKGKTLSSFQKNNSGIPSLKGSNGQESEYQFKKIGDTVNTGCCGTVSQPCSTPDSVTNLVSNLDAITGSSDPYIVTITLSWDASPSATSYTILSDHTIISITPVNSTSSVVEFSWSSPYNEIIFTVIANNSCGSSPGQTGSVAPCFLAGSLVYMADGTTKYIEDILVGDSVIGAFGEINTVLALHRPLLGNYHMVHINSNHFTSAHHPHITFDKKFVCVEPSVVENETYGREHIVINQNGDEELRMLYGLNKGRVQQLQVGTLLKGIHGEIPVETIEFADMPADTQLYNLVVSGSHTYNVDGYAVTGWPREDDFNYDTWS
jgi:hypothetical protein